VELIARVANVFIEVLAGQERLRLAEETSQLAQKVVNTVARRVQAGKVPPIEETRAGVAFSTTRIELVQAQRDLAAARKRLTLLWATLPAIQQGAGRSWVAGHSAEFRGACGARARQPDGTA